MQLIIASTAYLPIWPLRKITMKNSLDRLAQCLIVIGACHGVSALADAPRDPQSDCYWNVPTPGMKDFRRDVGTLYIPRDAKVGSVIGGINVEEATRDAGTHIIRCMNDGTVLLEFEARATAPIFSGPLDPIDGEDVTGKILQTNIPGVGVRVKLGFPFHNQSGCNNCFVPIGGTPTVPYRGVIDHERLLTAMNFSWLRNYITLVKTGPISAGPQQLNGSELFAGHFTTLGRSASYGLTGTIIQAQCTVGGNPVSADPVQLGEWSSADFTGPGYTTTPVPFSITLSNCETDTSGAVVTTANILLDGVKGSVPVGPTTSGVFSLTSDSDAAGVGIQILKDDSVTPMELQTEVPVLAISQGSTVLNFNARFYQTGASSAIRPGIAKGALSFTLTYK